MIRFGPSGAQVHSQEDQAWTLDCAVRYDGNYSRRRDSTAALLFCALSCFIAGGCGTGLPGHDTLRSRNLAALNRFENHLETLPAECQWYLGWFAPRQDVAAALCDLEPFFECQMQRSCDEDFLFFGLNDGACTVPEGCIPGAIDEYDSGKACLAFDAFQTPSPGTETLALPATVYQLQTRSGIQCIECVPNTVTNSCFSSRLEEPWVRVSVQRTNGEIRIEGVSYDGVVLAWATGRIDEDGAFVAVVTDASTADFESIRVRMEGRITDTGIVARFVYRASNRLFQPSDFQFGYWAAYLIEGMGCSVADEACYEAGVSFETIAELRTSAELGSLAGLTEGALDEFVSATCSNICSSSECDACQPCIEAIMEDPCLRVLP